MKQRFRTGGLAAWSIKHPIGISMLTLTVVILGLFSLQNLGVNLLPQIISPDILVRINDPGVPASIMEDRVTRQLEEQLAITEGATSVQSRTREGRSAVDLSFPYGTDINDALRDASIRLERAKRFLPENDEAPIIYKRDPSQIPVLEIVASSNELNSIELRSWVDYTFSKWFLNIPGVASVEIGGGLEREIQVLPNQEKMATAGLTLQSLASQIKTQNTDAPGGQMHSNNQIISVRTAGRFQSLEELRQLPLHTDAGNTIQDAINLEDVAQIIDGHKEERLRIRLNRVPGIKMSIQKQPQANTVAVVEEIKHKLQFLQQQNIIPNNINIAIVGNQSTFVKHAMNNATTAALSGAAMAMLVIYLFLGSIRRTLIIGSAIPIGILVTFILMQALDLTLNIMTLGGLALGMGLLIDSTIVMLENITRHQNLGDTSQQDAIDAAIEVNSPIVASTSTNLAALLPFLFIGGLSGLLFQELIITITSAMVASLIVALTLVPALGARVQPSQKNNVRLIDRLLAILNTYYKKISDISLQHPWFSLAFFIILFSLALAHFFNLKSIYLPNVDEGLVSISITGDSGMQLDEMDDTVEKIEQLLINDNYVESLFTSAGGFIFGRTEIQSTNRSSIKVQLVTKTKRAISSEEWLLQAKQKIKELKLVGFRTHLRVNSIRGVRTNNNDDDISLHIRGNNLETLRQLGDAAVLLLKDIDGLTNVFQSYEQVNEELKINIDRQRAENIGVDSSTIGRALRIALEGEIVTDYIEGEKNINIRLKLPHGDSDSIADLNNLFIDIQKQHAVRLGDIATIERHATAKRIIRYQQQRIVQIHASYAPDADREPLLAAALKKLNALTLPEGYILYDNDSNKTLKQSRKNSQWILIVAIFLVLVVMAVQYESLLNPVIIILSIPFSITGVALGFYVFNDMPISMPVWLGLIMLTGIVVNNAIVLVEQIELERSKQTENKTNLIAAIQQAAALRLRPILMTTLTTVFGMLPLALGLGEGAEMLQPLAFVIVWGLSFSMLVSLVLVPIVYSLFHKNIKHSRLASLQ